MPLSNEEMDRAFLGYDFDAENLGTLMGAMTLDSELMCSMATDADADMFLDYDDVAANTVCENQGQQNSCGGNSLATALEWIWNPIKGTYTQLSRQCAYIWGQGNARGDNGMSIEGGVKVAGGGVPPEPLWPYPNPVRYMTSPPAGVTVQQLREAAKPFAIDGFSWCDRFDSGDKHLAAGQGALYIGIPWRQSMASGQPVIETFSGGYRGWHAVTFLARSPRKDRQGRRYWWLANSHGPNWARRGLAEVSPAAVDQMFRDGARVCGLSDSSKPLIRKWDYKKRRVTH